MSATVPKGVHITPSDPVKPIAERAAAEFESQQKQHLVSADEWSLRAEKHRLDGVRADFVAEEVEQAEMFRILAAGCEAAALYCLDQATAKGGKKGK